MKLWTSEPRRWRKKGKRGVSPIIATILLVAITVVLAAVLYILISGLTKGPGTTPLGTAFAWGQVGEGKITTTFYYNISIASASGGILANNLNFQVQTASGGIVAVTGTMTILNLAGASVATYNMATGAWTTGGTVTIASTQTFQLALTVPNTGISGDSLEAIGVGSFQGSVPVSIP